MKSALWSGCGVRTDHASARLVAKPQPVTADGLRRKPTLPSALQCGSRGMWAAGQQVPPKQMTIQRRRRQEGSRSGTRKDTMRHAWCSVN